MYNRIVASPGQALELGRSGGRLLLDPPKQIAGQLTLTDMENRVWHLLRENGPDNGFPPPQTGDFPQSVVDRDLNIALGQFISETGIAPALSERQDILPVFPLLDYPVPPSLVSLARIEYTQAGQQPYKLIGLSFEGFDAILGNTIPLNTGPPGYFRQVFAGYVRLQPQPGPSQATGPSQGVFTLDGSPVPGNVTTLTIQNGAATPITVAYPATSADTVESIMSALGNLINASGAVVGPSAFLYATSPSSNQLQLTSLVSPGTNISYVGAVTGTTMTITPNAADFFAAGGDTMTWYYTSMGNFMLLPGDTPGIPPQFHMGMPYRVLSDYWLRKQDKAMAELYMKRHAQMVEKAKSYTFDLNRATQPTAGGFDDTEDAVLGYML